MKKHTFIISASVKQLFPLFVNELSHFYGSFLPCNFSFLFPLYLLIDVIQKIMN